MVYRILQGLCVEIFGPTLKDLAIRFNTENYASVSRASFARGVGGCIGGIVAGILSDTLPRWLDLMLVSYTGTVSVVTICITMVTDVDQLWYLCMLLGAGVGGLYIVGQRLIIVMWKERASSPIHALHMGFGIGAILIQYITEPFLGVTRPLAHNHTDTSHVAENSSITIRTLTVDDNTNIASQTANSSTAANITNDYYTTNMSDLDRDIMILRASQIDYVFYLVGSACLLSSVPFIVYQCLNSDRCNPIFRKVVEVKRTEGILQMLNPSSYTAGSLGFALIMFTMMFVYFSGDVGGQQLFDTFMRTYSADLLHLSQDSTHYLIQIYWISFTASRFLGAIFSMFVKVRHLILIQVVLNLISVTSLTIFMKTETNLWIFPILLGVMYGPLYPLGVAFTNSVMDVRGFCLTVISLAASLGQVGYIWIAGMLYDYYGPHGFMYTMQASGISIFLAVIGFRLASYRRKSPNAKQYHTEPEKLAQLDMMSVKGAKRSQETAGLLESSEDEL